MSIEFEVSDVFSASQEVLYFAWLDSEQHSLMTGSPATVSAVVGDRFEAWEGYIQGRNLEMESPNRILQRWRTTEFEEDEDDSLLEVIFEAEETGTRVTIRHSNLPEHGMQYKQGWIDSYFIPMKSFFDQKRS